MADQIPARVAALAAQIGDEPIAWNERTDGSITIVFCNKGKHTFDPVPVGAHSVPFGEHVAPASVESHPAPAPVGAEHRSALPAVEQQPAPTKKHTPKG
jgi:hypothetical protein